MFFSLLLFDKCSFNIGAIVWPDVKQCAKLLTFYILCNTNLYETLETHKTWQYFI